MRSYIIPLLISLASPMCVMGAWPQWGGTTRDFKVADIQIAGTWPKDGPKQIWRRDLGDGYSSVISADDRLITMYRKDQREHVIALNPLTGDTLWEYDYAVQFIDGTNVEQFGPGPLSTPLATTEYVFAIGVTGMFHCLDPRSGELVWKHELISDFDGTNLFRGYSASPIVHGDTVILPVGGSGQGVVAFRLSDGVVQWKTQDFAISHVSPILIQQKMQEQLVVIAEKEIAGIDPNNGKLLWRHGHPIKGGYISSTPIWHDGRLVFSAAYGEGTRCVAVEQTDTDNYVATEIWKNNRMRVHHSNVIQIGDVAYGSSGDFSALLFAAIDLKSGKLLWRNRELGRVNSVYVDGKFILLREDGMLMLSKTTPAGVSVQSEVQLFDARAWTAPSMDGKRLYIRNRTEIMALEIP